MRQKGALFTSSGSSTKWVKEVSLGELGREKASLPLCESFFSHIHFSRRYRIGSSLSRSWSHRSCPGCSHGSSVGLLIGKRMAKGGLRSGLSSKGGGEGPFWLEPWTQSESFCSFFKASSYGGIFHCSTCAIDRLRSRPRSNGFHFGYVRENKNKNSLLWNEKVSRKLSWLDRRISLRNRKNRTISCNSSQYGMTKESSYKSRSIQNALDFCVSFGFIDSRRALLYRIGALALYLINEKGAWKRNRLLL